MYVTTFGSAYFLVDKFCDRKFAFEKIDGKYVYNATITEELNKIEK